MAFPKRITVIEVGPREGYQFEGIGQPNKIPTAEKIRLVDGITPREGIRYTAVYLNDVGLKRAQATGRLSITGKITLTASETFALKNQNRKLQQDREMQEKMLRLYRDLGIQIENA